MTRLPSYANSSPYKVVAQLVPLPQYPYNVPPTHHDSKYLTVHFTISLLSSGTTCHSIFVPTPLNTLLKLITNHFFFLNLNFSLNLRLTSSSNPTHLNHLNFLDGLIGNETGILSPYTHLLNSHPHIIHRSFLFLAKCLGISRHTTVLAL